MSNLYLEARESIVLVVDVQGRLFSVMPELSGNDLVRSGSALLEAAGFLGVQVIATEQYPEKLGHTLAPLAEKLDALSAPRISKLTFSACREPAFDKAFNEAGRKSAIVIGMETHICVYQTVRDLCGRGFDVHVPIDGVASRRDDHKKTGLDLCQAAGATLTTTETILFDWLGKAGTEEFRKVSKLIK
jgi:nicotinamidase-related amidase